MAVKEWEYQNRTYLAQIDPSRLQEHYKHFDGLIQLIQSNPDLKKHTHLVIPVVTKYDIWYEKLDLEDFHECFADKIRQLGQLGRDVTSFMAASPVEYYGTPQIMNEVFRRAGREYQFLNWKWRKHPVG